MPRAGLTRERIAQQAAAVADETGFDRLTLRRRRRPLRSIPARLVQARGRPGHGTAGRRPCWPSASSTPSWPKRRRAWPGGTRWLRFPRPTAATPPRIRAVTPRACAPRDAGDEEHNAAGAAAVGLIANVLKGYRIEGDDMIDAVRMLRAALHGFVTLEAAGGFGLPQSVDGTFTRLVDSLHIAGSAWSTETGRG